MPRISQDLQSHLSQIISDEYKLCFEESELSMIVSKEGYQGFKRMFKCYADWHYKRACKLKKFIIGYDDKNLPVSINANTTEVYKKSLNEMGEFCIMSLLKKCVAGHLKHWEKIAKTIKQANSEFEYVLAKKLVKMQYYLEKEIGMYNKVLKGLELAEARGDVNFIAQEDKHLHDKILQRNAQSKK